MAVQIKISYMDDAAGKYRLNVSILQPSAPSTDVDAKSSKFITCVASQSTMPSKMPKGVHLLLQFRAGLRIPSAALEERRNVGHDEAETVQNRPGDGNALKPCAGIIHGLAVLGKVHQQQATAAQTTAVTVEIEMICE